VNTEGPVRIQYNSRNQFKSAAKSLGIMDDFKVGASHTLLNAINLIRFVLTERRATDGVQRRRVIVLQQATRLPCAEHQLERLRPVLELTGQPDVQSN
jgi:GNT-I family